MIKGHEGIKDYNMWGQALGSELRVVSRINPEKAVYFETIITFTKLMAEASLDKECIKKFAMSYCEKYMLTPIQTDAISVFLI